MPPITFSYIDVQDLLLWWPQTICKFIFWPYITFKTFWDFLTWRVSDLELFEYGESLISLYKFRLVWQNDWKNAILIWPPRPQWSRNSPKIAFVLLKLLDYIWELLILGSVKSLYFMKKVCFLTKMEGNVSYYKYRGG